MARIGLSRASAVPERVQGLGSNLDDLKLRGENFRAFVGDSLVGGTLARTITGASTLTLELLDPDGKLLRSPLLEEVHHLNLDGLGFAFVKVRSEGRLEPLELTYEPNVVARLKRPETFGPRKAFRDKSTRAEFAKRLLRTAPGPPIKFVCPQLHVKQPIKDARASRDRSRDADAELRRGLDKEATLTVKGAAASPAQIKLGDLALRIGEETGAPYPVQVALIAALIVESELGKASSNVLQALGAGGAPIGTPEEEINGFLTNRPRWTGEGAIEYHRKNPGAPPWEIAQATQASAFADGSNYREFNTEAREWVDAYSGGSFGATVEWQRYAFEQGRRETAWKAMGRLAGEVNWRRFERHGWVYFIAEPDLLAARRQMIVSDATPGVLDTAFDYDVGKPITEVTVEARANLWAAPPGSIVEVKRHGPADGRYLVDRIESPLAHRETTINVELKKPTEPLPEPLPERKSSPRKIGGGGNTSIGMGGMRLEGTPEDVVNSVIYFAREELGFDVTAASVRAANGSHGPTSSGGLSDHQGPPQERWAADISNGTSPTPEMDHLAAAIAKAFGIPWSGSGAPSHITQGYRLQLIYRSPVGGNHFNHVHFGVEWRGGNA